MDFYKKLDEYLLSKETIPERLEVVENHQEILFKFYKEEASEEDIQSTQKTYEKTGEYGFDDVTTDLLSLMNTKPLPNSRIWLANYYEDNAGEEYAYAYSYIDENGELVTGEYIHSTF